MADNPATSDQYNHEKPWKVIYHQREDLAMSKRKFQFNMTLYKNIVTSNRFHGHRPPDLAQILKTTLSGEA